MKHLSLIATLFVSSFFFMSASFPMEQVMPIPSQYEVNSNICAHEDFSGLEEQVKNFISERYSIPISSITSCYYDGVSPEGWGRYPFTTTTISGIILVRGIIGDEIDA